MHDPRRWLALSLLHVLLVTACSSAPRPDASASSITTVSPVPDDVPCSRERQHFIDLLFEYGRALGDLSDTGTGRNAGRGLRSLTRASEGLSSAAFRTADLEEHRGIVSQHLANMVRLYREAAINASNEGETVASLSGDSYAQVVADQQAIAQSFFFVRRYRCNPTA
jgi:hypothetical protein